MATVQTTGRLRGQRTDPLSRDALFRQIGTLVGAVLLGFLSMATRQAPDASAALLVRASVLAAATVIATVLIPWHRLPSVLHRILPFLYLLVVYLARSATGGVDSAYSQLAFLPLMWVAVYGSLGEFLTVLTGTAVVLVVPLVSPGGADAEWARTIGLLVAGGALGLAVHRFFIGIRRQSDRLQLLAGTDALTGAANRRAWDEELASAIVRSVRDGRPFSVALIDLDDFKGFNDQNGHQAGDRLLKEAAAAWMGILRASDILARIGGDEFGALLPGCDIQVAATIAEKLRAAVPAAKCSVGVAMWDGTESVETLLARADGGLYEAKEQGRGRVVVLPEPSGRGTQGRPGHRP